MTVQYSELTQDIQFHIPNCPSPLINKAVKRAVRSFCGESHAHRVYLSPITVVGGTDNYSLTPPAGFEIVQVLNVRLDGVGLTAVSESLLDGRGVDWDNATGKPTDYFLTSRNEIRLYPNPSSAGTLTLRVSLRPTRAATGGDDTIMDRYWDEIVWGALGELFMLDNTPWEDANQAQAYIGRFVASVEKARLEVHNDDQPKLRVVRYGGV